MFYHSANLIMGVINWWVNKVHQSSMERETRMRRAAALAIAEAKASQRTARKFCKISEDLTEDVTDDDE